MIHPLPPPGRLQNEKLRQREAGLRAAACDSIRSSGHVELQRLPREICLPEKPLHRRLTSPEAAGNGSAPRTGGRAAPSGPASTRSVCGPFHVKAGLTNKPQLTGNHVIIPAVKRTQDFSVMEKRQAFMSSEPSRMLLNISSAVMRGERCRAVFSAGRALSPTPELLRGSSLHYLAAQRPRSLLETETPAERDGAKPAGDICGVSTGRFTEPGLAPRNPAVLAPGEELRSPRVPFPYKRAAAAQPLCWQLFSCDPWWAREREVSSRCKAPIEAPLIFQEFSGFGLYKPRQEEERGTRLQRGESPSTILAHQTALSKQR